MNNDEIDSRVVLMCGISGSGKTHYSRQLENQGYRRLSIDEQIWGRYGSGFADLPPERRKEIFMDATAELFVRLGEMLENGEKVVVDSTMCKRIKRDYARNICRKHGVEPAIIYMTAPLPVLWKRLSGRLGNGPDDLIVSHSDLMSYFENFEAPMPDENYMVFKQT